MLNYIDSRTNEDVGTVKILPLSFGIKNYILSIADEVLSQESISHQLELIKKMSMDFNWLIDKEQSWFAKYIKYRFLALSYWLHNPIDNISSEWTPGIRLTPEIQQLVLRDFKVLIEDIRTYG